MTKKITLKITGKVANGKNRGKKFTYIEYNDGTFTYNEG